MNHDIKIFSSVMKRMLNGANIDGIVLHPTNHTAKVKIKGYPSQYVNNVRIKDNEEYQIPTLRISNPKNIPFSYNTFFESVLDEFDNINNFAGTEFPRNILAQLIVFDDFEKNDSFIPSHIEKSLKNCIKNLQSKIKCRSKWGNIIYDIYGEFLINDNFDMFWDNSESFTVNIDFNVSKVISDDLDTNKLTIVETKEEMIEITQDIANDDVYVFERDLWPCFENLVEKPFMDTEWQYISLTVTVV